MDQRLGQSYTLPVTFRKGSYLLVCFGGKTGKLYNITYCRPRIPDGIIHRGNK